MTISEADRLKIEQLSQQARETFYYKLRAVEAIQQREHGSKSGEISRQASSLGVSRASVERWLAQAEQFGVSGIIDNRSVRRSA